MAFKENRNFFDFLRNACLSNSLSEWAPAENYILEERLSDARIQDFLNTSGYATTAPNNVNDWFFQHHQYSLVHVAQKGKPFGSLGTTFQPINQPAFIKPHAMEVVRVESLRGLHSLANSILPFDQVEQLIKAHLAERRAGAQPDAASEASLRLWIKDVSWNRDSRPTFAAPFLEVENILTRADWANRLRDALGLGHLCGSERKPTCVLLMRYNLERVRTSHLRSSAWAAVPTVLDDVGRSPNGCFFPGPKSQQYGLTVDLASSNPTPIKEFLHAPISYVLEDIHDLGYVTESVTDSSVTAARNDHGATVKPGLTFANDVPPRP
jgi:hypothetical protein